MRALILFCCLIAFGSVGALGGENVVTPKPEHRHHRRKSTLGAPRIPRGYAPIRNSESKKAPGAIAKGLARFSQQLSVTIIVRHRPDTQPLTDVTAWTETPPLKRKYLSREEWANLYGASTNDLQQVIDFANQHGLSVESSSSQLRSVKLTGTVKQLNRAFAVRLQRYQLGSDAYVGYRGRIYVPSGLINVVDAVLGLDNRPIAKPSIRKFEESKGPNVLTPSQVASLYRFPGDTATGQTIGLIELGGGFNLDDVRNYFSTIVHLPAPDITTVFIDGATNTPFDTPADVANHNSPFEEVNLDIAVAGASAPGAKIVVYFAPNTTRGYVDAVDYALADSEHNPTVLSISWGSPESTSADPPLLDGFLYYALPLGVTVLVSSGDCGSGTNCPQGFTTEPQYAASDPWVTSCGGTLIYGITSTGYSQVAWSGSGGGISNIFDLKYWQQPANIPVSVNPKGHTGRGVPDIAGYAGGYTLFLNGTQTADPWGGTSAVAPLYAGLVAQINAALPQSAGYLNFVLYSKPNPYFNDITAGSNGAYNAGPNWDAVTGWEA